MPVDEEAYDYRYCVSDEMRNHRVSIYLRHSKI
jgi:hypothetical protein